MAESRLEELRRRVAQEPASRLFAQLAEHCRRAGDHAEAIRVARTGLAVHPVYPAARLTLGRALLESGDTKAARSELEVAVRQAPENILASRYLAEALESAGELEGALRQYGVTLRLAPGDRELEARLGAIQTQLEARTAGSGGAAEKGAAQPGGEPPPRGSADAASDSEPPPFSSPTLAELYLRQGFREQAIEVYRRVVAENPDNERARARLGQIEALAEPPDREPAEGRRRKLQRTIDGLEALLGAARRR